MKIETDIECMFDDAMAGKLESALAHACAAVDGTAKRLYQSPKSEERFVRCVREYYWLVEPMIGVGWNLVDTRYENLGPPQFRTAPDFAQFIYKIHRCAHAHGDEVPVEYSMIPTHGPTGGRWIFSKDRLQIPDRVIWALGAIAVFSHVNHRLLGCGGGRYLTFDEQRFPLAEWWGREKDIRPLAEEWNSIRVKAENLGEMRTADPVTGGREHIFIVPPGYSKSDA